MFVGVAVPQIHITLLWSHTRHLVPVLPKSRNYGRRSNLLTFVLKRVIRFDFFFSSGFAVCAGSPDASSVLAFDAPPCMERVRQSRGEQDGGVYAMGRPCKDHRLRLRNIVGTVDRRACRSPASKQRMTRESAELSTSLNNVHPFSVEEGGARKHGGDSDPEREPPEGAACFSQCNCGVSQPYCQGPSDSPHFWSLSDPNNEEHWVVGTELLGGRKAVDWLGAPEDWTEEHCPRASEKDKKPQQLGGRSLPAALPAPPPPHLFAPPPPVAAPP